MKNITDNIVAMNLEAFTFTTIPPGALKVFFTHLSRNESAGPG
jgi:hypothetical protein